jgi:DNA-binding NarL/FixJ family response regulator
MTSVVLVDDQVMIRAGLRSILSDAGIVVCGEAANGREALDVIARTRPDVVLMDLRMPILDGVGAITALRGLPEVGDTPVLVLTTFDGDRDVVAALSAGANGFLSKAADPAQLVSAVREVAGGRPSLSTGATEAVLRHLETTAPPAPDPALHARVQTLTARERDIVIAAAMGLDNGEIARRLFISPHTVKTHLNRAMVKLDARDRGQLVAAAYRAGLDIPRRDL